MFQENGQHINAKNSTFKATLGVSSMMNMGPVSAFSNIEELYGRTLFKNSHGLNGSSPKPSIDLDNCYADFIHSRIELDSSNFTTSTPVFGAALCATESDVNFVGTDKTTTQIIGASGYDSDGKIAGVYASNGSKVRFSGPTMIVQFPIDVLAENGSETLLEPQENLPYWNLASSGNHTMVELHSTRACLVANNNSTITMRDMGDYHAWWSPAVQALLVEDGGVPIANFNYDDAQGLQLATSSGYVQFYPNPQSSEIHTTYTNPVEDLETHYVGDMSDTTKKYLVEPLSNNEAAHKDYSYGGVCVKVSNGSEVNVKNVHFPAGWENASGAIYDFSSLCSNLYIWNIADDSRLKAEYVSVSGAFGSESAYHGPQAVYKQGSTSVSGAPSSTPDTSSMSILDTFGIRSNLVGYPNDFYGKIAYENRGPFRLFFTPNGPAKFLGYHDGVGGLIYGAPYQQLAQGYNPSGDCSAVSSTAWVSDGPIYQELYPEYRPGGTTYDGSSFYYVSSMLDPGYKNRVFLDDSGMNTFANAKNATVGDSGRLKLVTYFRNLVEAEGDSYDTNVSGYGLGFLSAGTFDLGKKS